MAGTTDIGSYNLLVVSDLHLSEGRDPESKSFSRNEDFFFDEEFARFLEHYQRDPRWAGARWHLIINGDFADLLQVVTTKSAPAELHGDRQSKFGLACGEAESVYKIARIADGHWLFFEALAAFIEAGNLLTIIRGNHDVEFHYPKVQQAFVAALQAAGEHARGAKGLSGLGPVEWPAIAANVRFSDWFYHEPKQIWIEHGNRYDGLNSFERWLSPLLPRIPRWPDDRRDEIDLPFGSLFVRYLFNRIERVEPFADNIKPASKFIAWVFRRHPITALFFAFGDGRYLLARVRRAWRRLPADAYDQRDREHRTRLAELALESRIAAGDLEELDRKTTPSLLRRPSGAMLMVLRSLVLARLVLPILGLLVLVVVLVALLAGAQLLIPGLPDTVRNLLERTIPSWVRDAGGWALLGVAAITAILTGRWLLREEETPKPSFLRERAEFIAAKLGVRCVVMGHTHDPELYAIGKDPEDGRSREYFNTGTWTRVFSDEERLIREDVEFVFLEGIRKQGHLRMKLMEWNDAAGCPELLKLFRDE